MSQAVSEVYELSSRPRARPVLIERSGRVDKKAPTLAPNFEITLCNFIYHLREAAHFLPVMPGRVTVGCERPYFTVDVRAEYRRPIASRLDLESLDLLQIGSTYGHWFHTGSLLVADSALGQTFIDDFTTPMPTLSAPD